MIQEKPEHSGELGEVTAKVHRAGSIIHGPSSEAAWRSIPLASIPLVTFEILGMYVADSLHAYYGHAWIETVNSRSKLNGIIIEGWASRILGAKPWVSLSSAQVAVIEPLSACAG